MSTPKFSAFLLAVSLATPALAGEIYAVALCNKETCQIQRGEIFAKVPCLERVTHLNQVDWGPGATPGYRWACLGLTVPSWQRVER